MYKKGQIVLLSIDEYSDYCIEGLVRIVKDFDPSTVMEEWSIDNADMRKYKTKMYHKKLHGVTFVDWLNENNYTENINYREFNVGDQFSVYLKEAKGGE